MIEKMRPLLQFNILQSQERATGGREGGREGERERALQTTQKKGSQESHLHTRRDIQSQDRSNRQNYHN